MFRTKEVIPNLCNESENRDDENDKAINLNLTDNHKAKNVTRPQIIDVNQNGDGQNISHTPDKSTNVDMDYDSSDEEQSKALNFSDSDLPDSPEIEAYVASFQKEANTECQFSESEQGNSSDTEEFNPFVFRKKKSKPVSTVTANLNTLPSRVSTRYRKPFIENATAHILKPTYLTEQEPEIDADIVAENIKRLRIYNEFKDVSNRINQNVSQNKTDVRNNKAKEVLTTISGTEIEASSILPSTTINRLTRSDKTQTRVLTSSDPETSRKRSEKTKNRQSIPNDSQQEVTTFRITRSRSKESLKQVSKPTETIGPLVRLPNSAKLVLTSFDSAATSNTSQPTQHSLQEPSTRVSTSSDPKTSRKGPQKTYTKENRQSIQNDSQQEDTTLFRITRSRLKETPKVVLKPAETIVTPRNSAKQALTTSDSAAALNIFKPTQEPSTRVSTSSDASTRVSTSSDSETSRKRSEKTKSRQHIPNDSQQEATLLRITRSKSKQTPKQVSKPAETIVTQVRPPNSAEQVLTSSDSVATLNTLRKPLISTDTLITRSKPRITSLTQVSKSPGNELEISGSREYPKQVSKPTEAVVTEVKPPNSAKQALTTSDSAATLNIFKPTQDSLQEPSTRVSTSSDPKTSRKGPQKTYTKENRQSIQNDSQQEDTTLFRITRSRLKETPKVVLKPAETIVTPLNSAKQALTTSDSAAALNIFKPTQEPSTRVSTSSDASTRVSTSSDSWTQESTSSDSETSRKRSEKTKSRQNIPNDSQQEATLLRITRSKSKQTPKQVSQPPETISTEVSPQNSAEQILTSSDSVTTWGTSQEPPKRTETLIPRSKPRIPSLTQVSKSPGDELEVSELREYPKQISKPTETIVTEVKRLNSAEQVFTSSDSAVTLNTSKPTQNSQQDPQTRVSTSSDPETLTKGPEKTTCKQSIPNDSQQEATKIFRTTRSRIKETPNQVSKPAETLVTEDKPPNSAEQVFTSSDSVTTLNTSREPSISTDTLITRSKLRIMSLTQVSKSPGNELEVSGPKEYPKQVSKPTETIGPLVRLPNSAKLVLTSFDSAATSNTSQPTQHSLQEPSTPVSTSSEPKTSRKGPQRTTTKENRQSIPNDIQQEDTTLFRITRSRLKDTPKVVLKPAETIVTPRNSAKQALTTSDSAAALNIFKPTQEPSTRVSTSSDASTRVSTSSDSWTQESTSSDSETSRKRSEKTKSRQNIPNDSQQEATLLRITRSKSKQTPKQVSQPPETISTEVSPQNSAEQILTSSDSVTTWGTSQEPPKRTETLIPRSKPRIPSLTQVSKSPSDELEVSGSREYPKQISKPTEAIVTEVKRPNSAKQALTTSDSAATLNIFKPTQELSTRVSTSSDPSTGVSTSSDPVTSSKGPEEIKTRQSVPYDFQLKVTTNRSKQSLKQLSAETTVTQVSPPNWAKQVLTSSDSVTTSNTSQEPPIPTETLIPRSKPRIPSLTQVSKSPSDELAVSGSREYPKQISKPTEAIVTEVKRLNSAKQVLISSDSAATLNTSKPTEDSLSFKRLSTSSDPETLRKGPKKTKKRQSIPNDSQQEVTAFRITRSRSKETPQQVSQPPETTVTQIRPPNWAEQVLTSSDSAATWGTSQEPPKLTETPINRSKPRIKSLTQVSKSPGDELEVSGLREYPKQISKPTETIVTEVKPLNSAEQVFTSSYSAAALETSKPTQNSQQDPQTRVSTSSDPETLTKGPEKTKSRQSIPNDSQQKVTTSRSKQSLKQLSAETIVTQVSPLNLAKYALTSSDFAAALNIFKPTQEPSTRLSTSSDASTRLSTSSDSWTQESTSSDSETSRKRSEKTKSRQSIPNDSQQEATLLRITRSKSKQTPKQVSQPPETISTQVSPHNSAEQILTSSDSVTTWGTSQEPPKRTETLIAQNKPRITSLTQESKSPCDELEVSGSREYPKQISKPTETIVTEVKRPNSAKQALTTSDSAATLNIFKPTQELATRVSTSSNPSTGVSTSSDSVTSSKGPEETKTRQSVPYDFQQKVTTSRSKQSLKQLSAETTVTQVSPLNSAKQVLTSSDSVTTSNTSQEPPKLTEARISRSKPRITSLTQVSKSPGDELEVSGSREYPKQISKPTETIVTEVKRLNSAKQVLTSSDSAATLNTFKPTEDSLSSKRVSTSSDLETLRKGPKKTKKRQSIPNDSQQEVISKPTQDNLQDPSKRVSTSSDPETSRRRPQKTTNKQSIPNDSQQEVTTLFRITRSRSKETPKVVLKPAETQSQKSKETPKQISKLTEAIVTQISSLNLVKQVLISSDSAATLNASKPTQDSLQEPQTRVSTSSDPETSRKRSEKTKNRQKVTTFRITRSRLKDTPKVVLKPAETLVTPRNSAKQALTSSGSAATLNIFKPTQEPSTRVSTSSDASTRVSTSSDSWTQESTSSDSETSRKRSEKTKSRQNIPNDSQQEATLLRITRSKSKQTPKQVSQPPETISTEVSPQNSAEQILTSSDSVTTWGTSQEPPKRTETLIAQNKPRITSLTQESKSPGDELEVSGSQEYPKQISKPTEAIVTEVKPPNSAKQALTTSDSAATLNIFIPTQELATRVSTSSDPSTGVSTSSDPSTGVSTSSDPVTSSKGPEEIKTRQSVPYDFQQKVTTSRSKQSLKQLSAETTVSQVSPPNWAKQVLTSSDSVTTSNTSQEPPKLTEARISRSKPRITSLTQVSKLPGDELEVSGSREYPKQVSKPAETTVIQVRPPNSAEQVLTSFDSAATSNTSKPTQDSLQEPSTRVSTSSDPKTSRKGPKGTTTKENRQSIPSDIQQEDTTLFRITRSRLKDTPKVVLKPAETIVTPLNSAKQALTSSDSAAALNIFKPTQEPSTRVSTSSDASTRVSTSSDSWTQESTSSDSETSRKRSEKTKSRQNIPNDSQQEATLLRITRSKSKQTPKQVSQPPESTQVNPQNSAEQILTSSDSVTTWGTSQEPPKRTETLIPRSKPRIMSLTQESKSPGNELEVSGSREYPKQISKPTEAIVTEVKLLNSAKQVLISSDSAATLNTSKPTEDSLSSKRVSTSSDPEASRKGSEKTKTRPSIPNDSQQEVTSKPTQDNIQDPSKRVSTSSDPETSRRGPQKTTNQQSIPNDSQQEVTTFRITRSRSKETPKQVSKPAETTVTQVRPPNSAEQVFTSSDSAGTWGTSQEPPKPTETLITRNKPRITSLTQVSKSPSDELEVSGSREYPKQISKPTEAIVTEVKRLNSAKQVLTSSDSAATLNISKPTEDSLSSKRVSTSSDLETLRKGPKKTKKRQSIPNDSQQEVISKPTQDNLQDPSKRVSTSSDPETSRRRPQKTTNKQSIPNDSQQEVTTLFRITRNRSKETPKVVLKPAETIVTPLNSAKQALTSSDSAAALNIFKPTQEPSTRVSTSSDASTRVSTSSDSWTQESISSDSETSRKRSEKTKSRQNIPNDSQQEATLLRITRSKSKQTPKQVSQPPETISTQPVVTQVGPEKTVATQIEPEKTVVTKSRSQKTEITQIGPEKTVASKSRSKKTVGKKRRSEKTVVTQIRPQKPVVTQIGPEKTVATKSRSRKTDVTQIGPEKTVVTQIGPEKTIATQIEPEKTVVTKSRSQKTVGTKRRPQKTVVTQIGPEKTVVTEIGPEKTEVTESRSQKPVVIEIGPEKTVVTQIRPQKPVVTQIGPEKTVATQIEPEKSVVTESRSQKIEVTQIGPEKTVASKSRSQKTVGKKRRSQKTVVTQIGPEKTVVTQIRPQKPVVTQIGPEKTVATKSRSRKNEVTQIGPEKTVVKQIGPEKTIATQIEPEKTVVTKSRSQKTVDTKSRPQKTVVTKNRPQKVLVTQNKLQKAVATQIRPQKTEVTESRPHKPVVTEIGPEKTVATQIEPEKTVVTKSRSQKTEVTQIGPEKTVATQIEPEKSVVTEIGPEKTVATKSRSRKNEVTQIGPEKTVATQIEPEKSVVTESRSQKIEVTQIGPEKTVATQIRPQKTEVTESRPHKPVVTEIGPEKTVATQIEPEKTVVTKSRSQKTEVTQIGPEKTVATQIEPEKSVVTEIGPEKTVATKSRSRKNEVTQIGPEKTVATQIEPEKSVVTESRSQKIEVTQIGPEKTVATQIRPQKPVVTQIGPEKTVATKSRSRKNEVTQIGPEKTVVKQIGPEKTIATQIEPEKTVVTKSRSQKTVDTKSRPQKTVVTKNRPQKVLVTQIEPEKTTRSRKIPSSPKAYLIKRQRKHPEKIEESTVKTSESVLKYSSQKQSLVSDTSSNATSPRSLKRSLRSSDAPSAKRTRVFTTCCTQEKTSATQIEPEKTTKSRSQKTEVTKSEPQKTVVTKNRPQKPLVRQNKIQKAVVTRSKPQKTIATRRRLQKTVITQNKPRQTRSRKIPSSPKTHLVKRQRKHNEKIEESTVKASKSVLKNSSQKQSSVSNTSSNTTSPRSLKRSLRNSDGPSAKRTRVLEPFIASNKSTTRRR
ncbi:hypothetical protein SFRURICE_003556 [Spodoptera frugiperda]|nr:hypothetical protein SFRURICE_003556 [Spodoptera frugiperda]